MKHNIKKFIHKTNNMLFRIISSAQLLKNSKELSVKDKERANIIFESSIEISKMVEELTENYNLYDWDE